MSQPTARVAQIGNLLTSPVFVTAFVGLILEGMTMAGVKVIDSATLQGQLIAVVTGVGTMLAHWATGPVSLTSTTMFPQAPQALAAGVHSIVVQAAPAAVQPPPITVLSQSIELPVRPLSLSQQQMAATIAASAAAGDVLPSRAQPPTPSLQDLGAAPPPLTPGTPS